MVNIEVNINDLTRSIFDIEEDLDGLEIFDDKKIVAYINTVESCNTIFKLVKNIDVDKLTESLKLIDIFYNSKKIHRKMTDIFSHVSSDFAVDYFDIMIKNGEYENESV